MRADAARRTDAWRAEGRSERLHPFADLAALQATLERLIERELVAQLPRRPGQKEERYVHRLSDDDAREPVFAAATPAASAAGGAPAAAPVRAPGRPMPAAPEVKRVELPLGERVARLESEVAQLRAELRLARSLRGDLTSISGVKSPSAGGRRRSW